MSRRPHLSLELSVFTSERRLPRGTCEVVEGPPVLLQAVEVSLQWLLAVAPPWHRATGGGFLSRHPRLSRGLAVSSQSAHSQPTVSSQSAHSQLTCFSMFLKEAAMAPIKEFLYART